VRAKVEYRPMLYAKIVYIISPTPSTKEIKAIMFVARKVGLYLYLLKKASIEIKIAAIQSGKGA
jgi:hypothetical protein